MNISNLNLEKPIKSEKCYYSACNDNLYFQLNNVCTMNKFYKKDGKVFIDILLNNKSIRKINNVEKMIKRECLRYYKIWNNKDIEKQIFYKKYVSIIESMIAQEDTTQTQEEEEEIQFDYDTDSDGETTDTSSIQEEYTSTFELDIQENRIKTHIINCNKSRISYKKVQRYNDVSLILSLRGIKFGKTKFKPHIVINKMKLDKREEDIDASFKNKCHITSDYENEAEEEGYLSYESETEREYVSKLIKKDIEKRKNKTFIDYLSD